MLFSSARKGCAVPPVVWIVCWLVVVAVIGFFYVRSVRRGRTGAAQALAWGKVDPDGPSSVRNEQRHHTNGTGNIGGY